MPQRRTSTSFKPGQSGNPKGRPPGQRMLAELLSKAGSRKILVTEDGKTVAANAYVCEKFWELLTRGEMELLGKTLGFGDAADWVASFRWLNQHLDGPVRPDAPDLGDAHDYIEMLAAALRRVYGNGHTAPGHAHSEPAPLRRDHLPLGPGPVTEPERS
jgi:hypothetical protein